MTRHLTFEWPDPAPFKRRNGAPIRLLAVSDMLDPTLIDKRNREAVGEVDLILGCGDLDCDDLTFIADGFNAPLVYVHGNHDADEKWASYGANCPQAIHSTATQHMVGLSIAGLTWPGARGKGATRSERLAWNQSLRLATRRLGHAGPLIIISHVPPFEAGDIPDGTYHRGFRGYRWLMDHLAPPLWLHGHTPLAGANDWLVEVGKTTLINATGAVVIDLVPPGHAAAARAAAAGGAGVATTSSKAGPMPGSRAARK